MRWTAVLFLIGALIAVKYLGDRNFVRFSETRIRRYAPDGRMMPSNSSARFTFQVESSVAFSIDHERFRLLGLKESENGERRREAMDFIETWLTEANGNPVWFTNWSQALQDPKGRWIVWARALLHGKLHCLNVDLAKAGLADIDYSHDRDYEFREPEYGGLGKFVNWRNLLDNARD